MVYALDAADGVVALAVHDGSRPAGRTRGWPRAAAPGDPDRRPKGDGLRRDGEPASVGRHAAEPNGAAFRGRALYTDSLARVSTG